MGYPLLVALALIATGVLFMLAAPPPRGRRPSAATGAGAAFSARMNMEAAAELTQPSPVEPEAPQDLPGAENPQGRGSPGSGGGEVGDDGAGGRPQAATAPGGANAAEPRWTDATAWWSGPAEARQAEAVEPEEPDEVLAEAAGEGSLRVTWRLRGRSEARLQAMLGTDRFQATVPGLRVFDVAGGGAQDVDVSLDGGETLVSGLAPGRRYVVALERRSPAGDRYLIAVSSPVEV